MAPLSVQWSCASGKDLRAPSTSSAVYLALEAGICGVGYDSVMEPLLHGASVSGVPGSSDPLAVDGIRAFERLGCV